MVVAIDTVGLVDIVERVIVGEAEVPARLCPRGVSVVSWSSSLPGVSFANDEGVPSMVRAESCECMLTPSAPSSCISLDSSTLIIEG